MSLVVAVIPVRYASTRFPGKALAPLGNGTLLEQVWKRASGCERIDRLIVATDDQRIIDAAASFGAEVKRTSRKHPSGTDRTAEVVRNLEDDYGLILTIQADEPLLTPSSLTGLIELFDRDPAVVMATLVEPIHDADEVFDPNAVKVVLDSARRTLYFSRAPIPYFRGSGARLQPNFRAELTERKAGLGGYLKHPGVYAYRRQTLLDLARLGPSPLERLEGLEQLRALEAGVAIHAVDSDFKSISVDTPADLERAVKALTEAS